MSSPPVPAEPAPGPDAWDPLVEQLRALRRSAGDPSLAVIAARIASERVAAGADQHAARVARSTVHDCFRLGRTRVNIALVREIVRALGGDPAQVETWRPPAAPGPRAELPAPSAPSTPSAPATPSTPEAAGPPRPSRPSTRTRLLLVLACVAANLLGRSLVELLHLPLHLDMTGTAVAALALGPWWGALVGLSTNVAGVATSGAVSLPFAAVNVAGALVWGYGVRRGGLGHTWVRFLTLCVLVAVTCTVVALPVLLALDGPAGEGHVALTSELARTVGAWAVGVGLTSLLVSLVDKVLSGFVAVVALSALPPGAPALPTGLGRLVGRPPHQPDTRP